jgi:poly(A) polymerase
MTQLPDAPWQHRAGLKELLAAIGAAQGGARFVGGAVRDTLLGHAVEDIDIATIHRPEDVIARLTAEGIKSVPTGLAHGTITAVLEGKPVEITTLRRDVTTDGRRAKIAYSDNWQEDAARRDFTMNALYADPASGEVIDYFGGVADLRAGHVRFIGHAADRIAEDHLRILRYFRFLARFGNGEPDEDAFSACVAHANSLMALSRERIADELLKLLATADPVRAIKLMVDGDIFLPVLPEITTAGVAHLTRLSERESMAGIECSPLRRLCALLPAKSETGEAVAARLKLSNKARKRIAFALSASPPSDDPYALAYRIGREGAIDRLLLEETVAAEDISHLADWERPSLPVSGGALITRGMAPGPQVADALRLVEEQWISEGFPDARRTDEIADQTVSKFQRARQ